MDETYEPCASCGRVGSDVAAVRKKTGTPWCFECEGVPEEDWDAYIASASKT